MSARLALEHRLIRRHANNCNNAFVGMGQNLQLKFRKSFELWVELILIISRNTLESSKIYPLDSTS